MVDTQVLPPPLHRSKGTHSHPSDGVVGEQLSHRLTLVPSKVEANILKSPLLGAKSGSLQEGERIWFLHFIYTYDNSDTCY